MRSRLLCWGLGLALTLTAPSVMGAQELGESISELIPVILDRLPLRSIGPAVMGGRIDDIAVVEDRPWIFYVGSASGGVFKTENNGTTFEPIFENYGTGSIGDLAIAPSDPEIVWVGTGEANNRQSSSFGDGIYKSTDGGRSFRHMGLADTQAIGRLVIHPGNPDVVYVAAVGHLWGPNAERGVFKTADGGLDWSRVLYANEDTGATDLVMDPSNPQVLYAALYQRRRTVWGFSGGGPGSGIFKTEDGGKTWKRLDQTARGLPEGPTGRIGLDIYRRDPRIVYAIVENKEGGLFRSEDRGENWKKVNSLNPRPMYYSQIRVDPKDDRRVYVLGSSFHVSTDGGRTFADPGTGRPGENTSMTPTYDVGVHGDHHALWIDPANGRHLILGGDGGLYFSWDGSVSWDKVANLPLVQFYDIAVDMRKPYFIYGGAQDTHSWGGPSATRHHIGIVNSDWFQTSFGDGMYQQVDPASPDVLYTESQGGNLVRFNLKSADSRSIKPHPSKGETPYRFHWTSPLLISPHSPGLLLLGGNRLFRSEDGGSSWTASADLTRNQDRRELPIMGKMPDEKTLSLNDGVSDWGTLTTISESPLRAGLIYVGTDDGNLQVSHDGGESWTNLSGRFPRLPSEASVSRVVASSAEPGRVYASFDRHQWDDFAPYVYVSEDEGKTWKSIASNLPPRGWVNVLAEHPRNPELLVLGAETGLFVSFNRGARWGRIRGSFPTVPVDDVVIHPRDNDLVVGTHGRGIYILDDLTPLERLTQALAAGVHLFPVRPATQILLWKHESYGAQRQFIGLNPPYGALIGYLLKSEPGKEPRLVIRDEAGRIVRELVGSTKRGLNRVVWDLRAAPPRGVASSRGPLVPAGKYTARLEVGERVLEEAVEVETDPLFPVTAAEARSRFEFLSELNYVREAIAAAVLTAESAVKQLEQFQEGLGGGSAGLASLAAASSREAKRIREALAGGSASGGGEGESARRSLRILAGGLFTEIDGDTVRPGSLGAPTVAQHRRLDTLRADLEERLGELNQLVETKVADVNRRANEAGLPRVRLEKAPPLPARR